MISHVSTCKVLHQRYNIEHYIFHLIIEHSIRTLRESDMDLHEIKQKSDDINIIRKKSGELRSRKKENGLEIVST